MTASPLRLLAAAVAFTCTVPAALTAQTSLVFGTWTSFEWFTGVGSVEGNGFFLDALGRTRLRVTDDGYTGDAFDIFINGALFASTPTVPGGVFTGAYAGDIAWNDPQLSKTDLFLNPGQYTITIAVREAGSGFSDGEGFIRADDAPLPPVTSVPEPGSALLMASGLVALALGRRRMSTRGGV